MSNKDDTVLHDICEGIGGALGAVGGIAVGGVGALAKGVFQDDWNEAQSFFDKTVETAAEEGGKIGREFGPTAVFGLLTILASGALNNSSRGGPKGSA